MIASDLASLIDAFDSILTDRDVEDGKILVRRADMDDMRELAKRILDGHERPLNASLHDMEQSCAVSRVRKEHQG